MASTSTEAGAVVDAPVAQTVTSRDSALLVGHRTTARVSGISVAFEMLVQGFEQYGLPFHVVDLAAVGATDRPGALRFGRVWSTLAVLWRYLVALPRVRSVYMTVATSRLGFLRDCLFLWSGHLLRRRVVVHLHGGGYRRFYLACGPGLRRLIRATLARADRIIVLGEGLRTQFRFVPDAATRVTVVRNGLPETEPDLLMTQKALPADGPVRLLYLSNMIPSKGYLDLLAACRLLADAGVDFHCDFCGEFVDIAEAGAGLSATEAERRFVESVRDWGLGDRVRWHGVVRGAAKIRFLREAHVFILPTSYPWEGQPISIIEAMAAATPVVATRHRGIPEQVVDDCNGILVPIGKPAAIAAAVRRLSQDSSVYARHSAAARRRFDTYFTREAHVRHLISVILAAPHHGLPAEHAGEV